MPQAPVQEVLDLLAKHRDVIYPGEQITVLELSLRTAFIAEEAKLPSNEITAALLRNLQHMLRLEGEEASSDEATGRYLRRWFGDSVVEPIRLQGSAKRYLCAIEPDYVGHLSDSSAKSLAAQGGPMSEDEAEEFSKLPYAEAAIRLLRLHDRAKLDGYSAPELDHFVPHLDAATVVVDKLSPSQLI